jgi:hypothetical protein
MRAVTCTCSHCKMTKHVRCTDTELDLFVCVACMHVTMEACTKEVACEENAAAQVWAPPVQVSSMHGGMHTYAIYLWCVLSGFSTTTTISKVYLEFDR